MNSKNANYRKYNDKSHCSSTYHKKDGTNIRAKLKEDFRREVDSLVWLEEKKLDRKGSNKYITDNQETNNTP